MSGASSLNKRVKSWPAWVLMAMIAAAFVVVGSTRSTGPQTPSDRVDEITQRIACPVCDGESVFESQNNTSRAIRVRVESLVRDNDLDDQQIVDEVLNAFGGDLLLVPKATGLDSLVWLLPAMGFVVGVTGLGLAFRRWRVEADGIGTPTADDRALVDAALADDAAHSDEHTGDESGER